MMAPSTRRAVLVAGVIAVLGRRTSWAQETRRTFRIGYSPDRRARRQDRQ